jgi:adenylate kinase
VHVGDASAPCPRCGGSLKRRSDDTAETLEFRFREYAEKTLPVVGYYEKRGVLHRVQTERAPGQVFAAVLEILQ